MVRIEVYMTILTLWKQGKSKNEIAKLVGKDRKTVRKIIKAYQKTGVDKPELIIRPGFFDQYKELLIQYLEKGLSAVRICEELVAQGIAAKYRTVARYIMQLQQKEDVCVRFHTLPGEEVQVDFGYVGILFDERGKKRKAWVFNMRLSYSRLDYYCVVFDQTVSTFINCHIKAFRCFGGVPQVVKIDNLKAAILEANFYEPTHQMMYKRFSEHYGFDSIPCRVREPQEKGKVESGVKYVKNNFFAGRKFESHADMSEALGNWLEHKCNSRIHGTTKKIPRELFDMAEKAQLKSLPTHDFIIPEIAQRKVCRDCHITVGNNYYSVPYAYVGKIVDVERDDSLIKILYKGAQVAVHAKSSTVGDFITNKSHYPKYKHFTHESVEYRALYKEKMSQVGESASQVFSLVLEQQPRTWYRTVTGILSLNKVFSDETLNLACKRALAFNITSYSKIKSICESGSYNQPVSEESI